MKKIALVILPIFITLAVIEIGLRLGTFGTNYLSKSREYAGNAGDGTKGVYRILCLGDSMTQGAYPKDLEDELNTRNTGIKFTVIDKGRYATNTNYILLNLDKDIDTYNPDIVVAMIGDSDERNGIVAYEDSSISYKNLKLYKLMKLIEQQVKRGAGKEIEQTRNPALEAGSADKKALDLADSQNEKTNEAEQIYVNLGNRFLEQGKYKEAKDIYRKAIALNPKNEQGYMNLGMLYRQQGRFKEAEEQYRKALEINPKQENAFYAISKTYELQKRYTEAAKVLKESMALQSGAESRGIKYKEIEDDAHTIYFGPGTIYNYKRLRKILKARNIPYVCVQYPLREIEDLRSIFGEAKDIIFVDNEKTFKDGVEKERYDIYFRDKFAGDFGHCTPKGNRLLAKNIADTVINKVLNK